jgi:uncharacterized RDD family membrane protein YckC
LLEKDNVKENKAIHEEEKTEVGTSNQENTNNEIESLVSDENNKENSFSKVILSNILDQSLVIAGAAIVLLLTDLILHLFGYQFVRETGALVLSGGIIYFILNCIYTPIIENSKFKSTIGKKILNI